MNLLIRQASPQDAAAISGIYLPYVQETPITFEETGPDAAEMQRRITATLEKYPYLVAEVDERVMGYAYASQHRERASYRWSVDVAVYLDRTVHRKGVGRWLYSALLPLLADQGFTRALAGITLPNAASVGLHESVGFTPIGIYHATGFKLGQWRDVGWWERALAPTSTPPAEPRPWRLMPALAPVNRLI